MRNALFEATGEAMPKFDRAAIMIAAWARYRTIAATGGYAKFDRRLFGRVLRGEWINARAEADRRRRAAAARVIIVPAEDSPLEIALDALKYLPAHMSFERAAAAVHARFPSHA